MGYSNGRGSPPAMLALGASSAGALRFPSRDERLPAVDERLVEPGTRSEMIDGKVCFAPPADEPHGTMHIELATVLRTHIAQGYKGALDMLTRTSKTNDFAPDASVFPEARDPETGGRRLEELAFEIASAQALGVPTMKARELSRRGVRRVFCVLVKKGEVLEWSREGDRFEPLAADARIEDRCFVRPLPVRALLDAADLDQAVVAALVARESPAIMALREEAVAEGALSGAREGEAVGMAKAIVAVLDARGLAMDDEGRARILGCRDAALLNRWIARAAVAASVAEVVAP